MKKSSFAYYAARTEKEILDELKSSLQEGLTEQEAARRVYEYGPNLVKITEESWLFLLYKQWASPFVLLFFTTALLFFLLHEWVNGIIVLCFVFINVGIGFFQEYRAAHVMHALLHYLTIAVPVRRNGKLIFVDTAQLVPGDIVELYPGEYVPADVRLLVTNHFFVDEASLTGESGPQEKTEKAATHVASLFEVKNSVFAGSTVVSGKAVGIVFATGSNTYMATIAALSKPKLYKESSLITGTLELGIFLVRFLSITIILIFLANLFFRTNGPSPVEFLIFSITLALSALPEALPIVVTFCLARGVTRLSSLKVIVKRLSAIEDLGGMHILCADKTGTLTENKMVIASFYPDDRQVLLLGSLAALHGGKAEKVVVHTFDEAFWHALSPEEQADVKKATIHAEIPFDPVRLYNMVLMQKNEEYQLIVRGRPEVIMNLCNNITHDKKQAVHEWIEQEGYKGNRILAIASKKVPAQTSITVKQESDFQLQGLVAFTDPLKKTARAAIEKAAQLGVQIKIISGDSKEVCGTVALQAGLIKDATDVVSGDEFAHCSFEKKKKLAATKSVFARMLPAQKHEIITLLRNDYLIGYLGDGINDAPALKEADVSIAVSNAANVARQAADILLLKTSLFAVVEGIQEGRKIVANTLKYVKTTLSATFGNFYAISAISFFIPYLPMQPIQILLVNLLTDFPMIAIATDSVDMRELRRPRKFSVRGMMLITILLGLVSTIFDFLFFLIFHRFSSVVVQSGWFVETVLSGIALIFSIRTRRFFLTSSRLFYSKK